MPHMEFWQGFLAVVVTGILSLVLVFLFYVRLVCDGKDIILKNIIDTY